MRLLKEKGQHILISKQLLRKIADYAEIQKDETVLEVGPGPGNLTEELINRADKVIGIEIDKRFVEVLKKRFSEQIKQKKFRLIHGDALKSEFPAFTKIVSNIPYKISSPLTFKLLKCHFKSAVLLYQKEFAERLIAKPGNKKYGRLSVSSRAFCTAEILEIVPRKAFKPAPKVDSAVVRLLPEPEIEVRDFEVFDELLRFVFSGRRKKIEKLLTQWLKKRGLEQSLIQEFEPIFNKRPEEIEPQVFAKIANRVIEDDISGF
jgi:16S rRNA (adenine1518-N6/adenine1519-N6)-dimethyltransferase